MIQARICYEKKQKITFDSWQNYRSKNPPSLRDESYESHPASSLRDSQRESKQYTLFRHCEEVRSTDEAIQITRI